MTTKTECFRSFRLDNGMKVNLVVNRSTPLVQIEFYVGTGYAWEPDALQGISHVVEHNLMHASPRRPNRGVFARDRRAMGAWYDAGTSYDYTEYLLIAPARHLRSALAMMADGFFSPRFEEDVFKSEMGAILQESKRKEDIPEPMVMEKLYSTAYEVHRRRRWRLGTAESLAQLTIDDLRTCFHERYGPKNLICLVGGDLDLDETEAAVREIFGAVQTAPVVGTYSPAEPKQEQVRYLELRSDLQRVYWICGFHTPAFMMEEGFHNFDLLAAVLTGGRGSRLIKRIKNKGLVDRIEARAADYDEYMMFNVYAETDRRRLAEAEEAILTEILALGRTGISPEELQRAQATVQANVLMRMDDLRRHLEWLSVVEGRSGKIEAVDDYANLLQTATPETVTAAARAYFQPSNLSICLLNGKDAAARSLADVALLADRAYRQAAAVVPDVSQAAVHSLPISAAISNGIPSKPRPPEVVALSNGPKLILQRTPANPVFALVAMIRGGRCLETETTCGLTDLMVAGMLHGTLTRDAAHLAAALEELGVWLEPHILEDGFGFTLYGPTPAFIPASDLLMDLLLNPAFNHEDLENEKRILLNRISALIDRPRDYSLALFHQELFKRHPYGLPKPGAIESVAKFTTADITSWHSAHLLGCNVVVSCLGDLEAGMLHDQVARLLGPLQKGQPAYGPGYDSSELTYPREITIHKDYHQTSTIVGYPTAPANSPDAHTLDLLSYLCQGDGGRFYDEIRSKRGLAYVVHALNLVHRNAGAFLGFAATAPDKAAEARQIFLAEFPQMWSNPPTEEDWAITKEYCLGQLLVRYRRNSLQRAVALADAEIKGQGYTWELEYESKIRAVTLEQAVATAKRYFPKDGAVVLTVGK